MVQAREEALKRANAAAYQANDQVKAFKTKLLMCDVQEERDHQLKLRTKKGRIEQEIEHQWTDLEKEKMEQYDDKLRAKLMKEYEGKMANTRDIKNQHYDFKMNFIKKMKEEQLEGELIKRQVEEEIERERQKQEGIRRKLQA